MAQRRHNFISGAAVLAFAVAVTKVLGALYKIPLGNLLDKEGMAHFYAAYNIYSLLLVLSTAGLPLALSRLVSRAAAQGRLNAQRRIFRTALALLAAIGLLCSAVMCLFPQWLSGLLHDSLAAPAIRALGPAVLFVCLTSAIRGYTQGLGDMTPTAVSQMTESAGKLVIGLGLCLVLLHRGADSSLCAAGAIAGVTAGSLLALAVLAVFLLRRRRIVASDAPPTRGIVLRELLTAGIPITLGAAGMSLITLLDQGLVMSTLQNTLGYTESAATALYGEYTFGMTLFALPPSFIFPVTVSLVPDIAAALARGDRAAAGRSTAAALKLTTLVALPAGAGLSVLAGPILHLLYPAVPATAEAAAYHLTILGIACIFVCLMVATNGVLQAYGKEYIPVVTLLCGGILKIVTNYLMVGDPATNVRGAPVSTLYCYALIVVLNLIAITRCVPERPSYFRLFGRPLLITAVMALAARSSYELLARVLPVRWAVLPAIAAAAVVYGVLVLALGAVTRADQPPSGFVPSRPFILSARLKPERSRIYGPRPSAPHALDRIPQRRHRIVASERGRVCKLSALPVAHPAPLRYLADRVHTPRVNVYPAAPQKIDLRIHTARLLLHADRAVPRAPPRLYPVGLRTVAVHDRIF